MEACLPDGRWVEVYDVHYSPGERGKTWGDPGECWPEVPPSVEFVAVVGDSEDDASIKREASDAERAQVYDEVLAWATKEWEAA